ncbi:G-protein coupled receptor Mth2-like [Nylanderia fulva]|uniref:G-protein coupled receptor Mth2-like n=1 Tax=Nylanderia fulva TaxID=613905 RepID=UPI0010FAD96E|nr:G-protein coupled receptor Mth2-like [Nylanderia fulva]
MKITTKDKTNEIMNTIKNKDIMEMSVDIASILLLGSAFFVYSILPELRNRHGFMLRNYNGALTIAYGIRFVKFVIISDDIQYAVCVTIAFIQYFVYMASYFWLIIMSFDMWCTFRGFCSLQKRQTTRKKKLIYYTIFAWGCPFMLAILCVSMDILSKYQHVPPILRPDFYEGECFFLVLVRMCCIIMGS